LSRRLRLNDLRTSPSASDIRSTTSIPFAAAGAVIADRAVDLCDVTMDGLH
jgi:hypothetical protein